MDVITLQDALQDWSDWDGASFELARCLGIIKPEVRFLDVKPIFWTDNPIGNTLIAVLDELVTAGILEKEDDPGLRYRWSPDFVEIGSNK